MRLIKQFTIFLAVSLAHASEAQTSKSPVIEAFVYKTHYNVAVNKVVGAYDVEFEPLLNNQLNLGFEREPRWFKVTLRGFTEDLHNGVLEVKSPIFNEFEVYESRPDGPKLLVQAGDEFNFADRLTEHRYYQIPLQIGDTDERTYFIKLATDGEQFIANFQVLSRDELAARDKRDLLSYGIYFGILLFVFLFNLFLFLIIRERGSILYVGYIVNLLFLQISLQGFGFQYLWSDSSYFAQISNAFFASTSIFFLILFSAEFLNIKTHYPKLYKFFMAAAAFTGLNAVVALIPGSTSFIVSVLAINVTTLALNVVIIPVAWGVKRKGFLPARYFLAAFMTLVATVFGFLLTNFGILKSEFFADFGLLSGSVIEVILLSFAIVDKFKRFKDDSVNRLEELNRMRVRTNEVLEERVKQRTEEITQKKNEIERQNEEIVSSIRYAGRIQQALLPDIKQMNELLPELFVYYKPRDIVSGDFYWMGRSRMQSTAGQRSLISFCSADCTGHGVPGALMSIMALSLLNDICRELQRGLPAEILNELNFRVVQNLRTQSKGLSISDGLDIAFCTLDPESLQLYFAGANQSILVVRDNEVLTLEGDRKAIGYREDDNGRGFTNHIFQLQPGDLLYSFTDGLPDQFGGELGKKLKRAGAKELILKTAKRQFSEQQAYLNQQFSQWQGSQEQVDDVCLLGIRISESLKKALPVENHRQAI